MDPQQALTIISIAAVVGTGFNMYLSLKISNSIRGLKLWASDKFVAKDDLRRYIREYLP